MKQFYFILVWLVLFSFISCSKNHGIGSNSVVIISAHDVEGKWQITEYSDSGIAKAGSFSSVIIQFNSSGTLSVNRNDTVFSGTWTILSDIGLDKLNIVVSTSNMPYGILGKAWYVGDKSPASLSLFYPHSNTAETLILQRL